MSAADPWAEARAARLARDVAAYHVGAADAYALFAAYCTEQGDVAAADAYAHVAADCRLRAEEHYRAAIVEAAERHCRDAIRNAESEAVEEASEVAHAGRPEPCPF